MAPAAHRMSKVDTAWLRMDTDANLMMIHGIWFIRPSITLEALRERVAQRLLQYPRFRQKVVEDTLGAQWVEDEAFDIAHHVQLEPARPRRGRAGAWTEKALQQRVAELASTPLDPARPLWQMHLVQDLDGASALIARLHHCIADGIALIAVMLSITDGGKPPPARRQREAQLSEPDWLSDALLKPITGLTVKAIGMAGSGVAKSVDLMLHPEQPLDVSVQAAKLGYQMVSDVAALALMGDDSPTRLKGKPGPGKRVAWGHRLPLDAVKAVGKAMGVSVNDVLLSCVAGALGGYLRAQGDEVDGKEIRAMVPVNLRPMERVYQLGNRFGLVPLLLPIGIDNPVKRLYAVHARMQELKGSLQPVLAFGLLSAAGLLIKPVQHAMLNIFARKATAVMTNVPGPAEPLKFCGSTVERVMFWVPQSGDIGVGVSILTYAGQVEFGLITDAGLCPDPQAVVDRFEPEFRKLLMLSLMLPWEERV